MATTPVAPELIRLLQRTGPMPLARYQRWCLQHAAGYYRQRAAIGSGGDFITAPEISQIFGEIVGAVLLAQAAQLPSARIIELGPGRGTLLADAARLWHRHGWRPPIHLVETNAPLRAAQAARLEGLNVTWHEELATVPTDQPWLLIANEWFDCLPVAQYRASTAGWHERQVAWTGEALILIDGPADPALRLLLGPATAGMWRELCPDAEQAVEHIARQLVRAGGMALIIDYGYRQPPNHPTLQAVRGHQPVDILQAPGQCDLSAHVDFARLATVAAAAGCAVAGPTSQRQFLLANGAAERAAQLAQASPALADAVAAGLHRLTACDQMGELFLCLCLHHPSLSPPRLG